MKLHRIAAITCLLLTGCEKGGFMTPPPGKEVADHYCSECHGMSGEHPGHFNPSPVATPSFTEVAARPEVNRQFLEEFFDATVSMPIWRLSASEKNALIDYILSLRSHH